MNNMSLLAPMIGYVSRRIFHHTNAKSAELNGLPIRHSTFTSMSCLINLRPFDGLKWNWNLHSKFYPTCFIACILGKSKVSSLGFQITLLIVKFGLNPDHAFEIYFTWHACQYLLTNHATDERNLRLQKFHCSNLWLHTENNILQPMLQFHHRCHPKRDCCYPDYCFPFQKQDYPICHK